MAGDTVLDNLERFETAQCALMAAEVKGRAEAEAVAEAGASSEHEIAEAGAGSKGTENAKSSGNIENCIAPDLRTPKAQIIFQTN